MITSRELNAYKIPREVKASLEKFEKVRAYAQLGARTPTFIRLGSKEYVALEAAIRKQSDRTLSLRDIYHNGLRIIGPSEDAPTFALESP